MPITTTLGALTDAAAALQRLATVPFPMASAVALAKLHALVREEVRVFTEQHTALVARFGEYRPATADEVAVGIGPPFVKPEHLAEFRALVMELCDVAVTLPAEPFNLGVARATCVISAADLQALGLLTEGALVVVEAG